MVEEELQIIKIFKQIIEASLIDQDVDKALSVITEDIIGIGMGSQGIVLSKEDVAKIIQDGRDNTKKAEVKIEYTDVNVRCYENCYATVCSVLKIKSGGNGNSTESTLGQLMNMRKIDGNWFVYTIQATPLFSEIEEMEAYPIKFAEKVLEKYRQQEIMAKNAQNESVAIYKVNYTKGIFEDAVLKSDIVVRTEPGMHYEEVIFEAATERLVDSGRYEFMSMFSLGNIFKAYQNNQTELSLEYLMILPDQSTRWMKTVTKLYWDAPSENLMGYMYVTDIHKEKIRELELENNAQLDSLTELYNKKYTELKIKERLACLGKSESGVFFMIDLDRFKKINDTYGHQEGDRVIQEASECIKNLIRKEDIAGRIGGDEFCIYFQGGISFDNIREKADALCEGIRNLIPSKENGTSCSIGIVVCQSPGMAFEDVYRRADEALYRQKKNGRNGYTIHGQN